MICISITPKRQSRWLAGRTGGIMAPGGVPSSMIGCSSMPASLGISGTDAAASPRRAGGASAAASVPAGNAGSCSPID